MKIFYAKSTGGFYNTEINGDNVPSDAVEIAIEEWKDLLDGQKNGMKIVANESGFPVLVARPVIEQPTEQTPMV